MNRRLAIRRSIVVVGLSLLTGLTAWMAVRGAESPESREIKARLKKQAERIASLEVSYRHETTSPLKPEKLVALADYRNKLFLPKGDWHEAYKRQKRFQRQTRPERLTPLRPVDEFGLQPPPPVDPKSPALDREDQRKLIESYEWVVASMKAQKARGARVVLAKDPDRDTTRAFNGRTLWMRRSWSEKADAYEVWPPKSEANWFQATPYSQATGLHWPDPTGKSPALKAQAMFQVADWVGDHSYQLDEKTEVIDGSTCVILKGSLNSLLQPGLIVGNLTDRIWLDRDHGLAVRRREFAKDGRVGIRWINTDLREVEPGLWLPLHSRQEHYAEDAPPEWKDRPVEIEEIRVTKIDVNQVADDLFDMTPRKSDHIEDLRGILPGR